MDTVVDIRHPNIVGRFQRYSPHIGRPGAVVKFPGRVPCQMPLELIRKTNLPWRNRRRKQQPKPETINLACNRLRELFGWTPEECKRKAEMAGLTIKQVLEAMTE